MREAEVFGQLAKVYDPELDQPLTELGFIGGVTVADGTVTVLFRLPTYWCAANFAFVMAADIRDRVSELPWVTEVDVQLQDHFASGEINQGVSGRKSFCDTFPGMAAGELEDLRYLFRRKSFIVRQERVLRILMNLGWEDGPIMAMSFQDVMDCPGLSPEDRALVVRYLAIRREFGFREEPDALAFTHPNGQALEPEFFREHLREARRTRVSMEFNGVFCSGLLKTRYGEGEAAEVLTPQTDSQIRQ